MSWGVSILVGLAVTTAAFIGMQIWMVSRMNKMRGKPAPVLEGQARAAIESGGSSLFYFFSPSCGACRSMTPVIKDMSRSDDHVFPVDVSQDFETARRFGVMATPTTIVVRDGLIAEVIVGARPEKQLRGLLAA